MRRRSLVGAALAAGLGGLAVARRRGALGRRREHVDVYYADGSMFSLEEGSPAGARLLALGREGLAAARA